MCQATGKQTEIEKADRGRLVGGGKGEMAGRKGQRGPEGTGKGERDRSVR